MELSNLRLHQDTRPGQQPRTLRSKLGKAEEFGDVNTRSARIILCDVDLYGGEEALAVRWARRHLWRIEIQRTGQRGLFAEVA